jgi:S1-C subfamily serine protease
MKIKIQDLQKIYDELKPIAKTIALDGNFSDYNRKTLENAGFDPFLTTEDLSIYRQNNPKTPLEISLNGKTFRDTRTLISFYDKAVDLDWQDGKLDGTIAQSPETDVEISTEVITQSFDWATLFERVKDSVFSITVKRQGEPDFSSGTGWIMAAESLPGKKSRYFLITNHHVIDDDTSNETEFSIQIPDKKTGKLNSKSLTLVGSDSVFDVAVLSFEDDEGRFAPLAIDPSPDSERQSGEEIMIVGNRDGKGIDFVKGFINQNFETNSYGETFSFEQDAESYKGNSGSPAFNQDGLVIGMHNSGEPEDNFKSGNEIFISEVLRSYQDIRKNGYAEHGTLKMNYTKIENSILKNFDPALDYPNGAWLVTRVYRDSLMNKEIFPGDIILQVGDYTSQEWEQNSLIEVVPAQKYPGESLPLKVWRNGKTLDLQVKLDTWATGVKKTWKAPDGKVFLQETPTKGQSDFDYPNQKMLQVYMPKIGDIMSTEQVAYRLVSINGKKFDDLKAVQKYLQNSQGIQEFTYVVADYSNSPNDEYLEIVTSENPLYENHP